MVAGRTATVNLTDCYLDQDINDLAKETSENIKKKPYHHLQQHSDIIKCQFLS